MKIEMDLNWVMTGDEYETTVSSVIKDEIERAVRATVKKELKEAEKMLASQIKAAMAPILQSIQRGRASAIVDKIMHEIGK